MKHINKSFLYLILMLFFIVACQDNRVVNPVKKHKLRTTPKSISKEKKKDCMYDFFGSKGIVAFNPIDSNLNKDITILNDDYSVYARINFTSYVIDFNGRQYTLDDFFNNQKLLDKNSFHPKEFYPDNYILQFEYLKANKNYAEIYIDKEKKKKKIIKLEKMFEMESWKEHFLGTIIDFDSRDNPIKNSPDDDSDLVEYEDVNEDSVFVIKDTKDDWIHIECSDMCGYPCGKKVTGWIRWKRNNKMIIRLLYSC